MDKSLKKLFKSFPYIVLKGKFLIPQAPKKPPRIFLSTNHLNTIKKLYPQLMNDQLAKMENKIEIQNICVQEYKKRRLAFQTKMKEYQNEYINPFKVVARGIQPQIIYLREHLSEIKELMHKESDKNSFSTLYRHYERLDEAEKQIYANKAEQVIKEQLKIYNQAAAKYKIPQNTYVLPHILYLRDTVEGPISISMYGRFKQLSQSQRVLYQQKSKLLRIYDKKILKEFVEKRQLTIPQFEQIKDICQKLDKQRIQINKQRKKNRAELIQDNELDESEELKQDN